MNCEKCECLIKPGERYYRTGTKHRHRACPRKKAKPAPAQPVPFTDPNADIDAQAIREIVNERGLGVTLDIVRHVVLEHALGSNGIGRKLYRVAERLEFAMSEAEGG